MSEQWSCLRTHDSLNTRIIRQQMAWTRLNVSMMSNEHHRIGQIQLQIGRVGPIRLLFDAPLTWLIKRRDVPITKL